MTRRDLFTELADGLVSLKDAREGKRTLRTTRIKSEPVTKVTAQEVKAVRESLNLSQPVFAHRLRTNTKTLQNWEQGRARPNAQACLLIRMIERFPDMAQRLESV